MAKKSGNIGLDQRRRDLDGLIRQKNASTCVATLRKTYGNNFAKGYEGNTKLETLLDQAGTKTISEYLKRR